MKPLSPHWADIAAIKILKSREEKKSYVLASGITPSGKVHIGNFREVITVDLVARALKDLGKDVRFIYSWDNFDTFRKVPKNLPDPASFEKYLHRPIARIPDPWHEAESYAQGRITLFEKELQEVGINPEYKYQEKKYSQGDYSQGIQHALVNKDKIKEILNAHRTTPLKDDWLPTSIYCSHCEKDQMVSQSFTAPWDYSYECSCGVKETVDIRTTKNLKLIWRVDWPMRWEYEKVDFEPGGKDHSSQGGSYDTGKKIVAEIWKQEAPSYLQYDFVKIKGGSGKMSSSTGELYTLAQVLEIYEPQIARWIFANQRPNHDFAIAFDQDVIKIYEEFDKAENLAFSEAPKKPGKWLGNKRTYELSCVSGSMPSKKPLRASFRLLCTRLQICDGDLDRTFERFYSDFVEKHDINLFFQRARRAAHWLKQYAPTEFKYTLHQEPAPIKLMDKQEKAILALREMINDTDLDSIEPSQLNSLIWEKAIHGCDCEPNDAFQAVYQKLIGRDQGPRLPNFLKEIGKERLLKLL